VRCSGDPGPAASRALSSSSSTAPGEQQQAEHRAVAGRDGQRHQQAAEQPERRPRDVRVGDERQAHLLLALVERADRPVEHAPGRHPQQHRPHQVEDGQWQHRPHACGDPTDGRARQQHHHVGDDQLVGRKLWGLTHPTAHQVIVVTHLPQLAGYGDVHFNVSKKIVNGRTITAVDTLDTHGRVQEMAAMLGTEGIHARRGAESILRQAAKVKENKGT
jgi:hypothetical protein